MSGVDVVSGVAAALRAPASELQARCAARNVAACAHAPPAMCSTEDVGWHATAVHCSTLLSAGRMSTIRFVGKAVFPA